MTLLRTQLHIVSWILALAGVFFVYAHTAHAAPNQQINYQGKLTDDTGATVADGTYNMRFWLITSPSAASTTAVWTESLTGVNRVQVTNGLFSIMLGSTSPLTSVDFNQTLYLGVEIGGSGGSPAWDGEMSPRKILGTVPAAFEAINAESARTFDGLATTSFLRSDQADTATGLITFTGGASSSDLVVSGTATTTNLVVSGLVSFDSALSVANGGTGATSLTGVLIGNGTSPVTGSSTLSDSVISDILTISSAGSVDSTALTDGGTISFDWVDDEIADTLTIGAGSTIADDLITPDDVLSAGQSDEYCLTYESSGDTWEWYDCTGAASLFTNSGNLTYLTEQTDNLAIGSTTNLTNARLLVRGTSTNDVLNLFSAAGAELFTVTSAGDVGIGTVNPSNSLDVIGNIRTCLTEGADCITLSTHVSDARLTLDTFSLRAGTSDGGIFEGASGGYLFSESTAASTNVVIDGDGISVNNGQSGPGSGNGLIVVSGNVGIGTSSPASLLDVYGEFRVGTSGTPLFFADVANQRVGIGTDAPNAKLTLNDVSSTDGFRIYEDNLTGHLLQMGARTITHDYQGNVRMLIGANVHGGATSGDGIAFGNGNSGVTGNGVAVGIAGSVRDLGFYTGDGSGLVERARIDGNGNMSIGTTSSNFMNDYASGKWLTIQTGTTGGGTSLPAILELVGSGNTTVGSPFGEIVFAHGAGNQNTAAKIASLRTGGQGGTTLVFETQGSEAMRIDAGGRLGIGTTTPDEFLTVKDGIKVFDSTAPYDTLVSLYDSSDDGVIDVFQNNTAVIRLHGGNANSYINSGGNFGIGTTTPSALFTVGNTTGNQFLADSSGNVTVGGTFTVESTQWDNGSGLIDGNAIADDTVGPDSILAAGQSDGYCLAYESTGDTWAWYDCASAAGLFTNSGNLTYLTEQTDNFAIGTTTNPGSARLTIQGTSTNDILNLLATNGSELLTVLSTGYVGIGDSSPAHLFTVGDGDIFGIDVSASGLLFTNSLAATTTVVNNNPFAWTIATSSTARPILRIDTTSGSEQVVFGVPGGDVYIGDVGSPSNLIFEEDSTIHAQGENTLTFGFGGDELRFAVDVGLATSSYLNWGQVLGTSGYGLRDNSGTIQFKNDGGAWMNVSADGAWATNGATLYYSGGKVGIGTSTATALLTVGSSTPDQLNADQLYRSQFIAGELEVDGDAWIDGSLTLGTALGVASGGTGAESLTGVLVGNGTSAFTATTSISDSYISDTLTIGSGSTFANNIITPNSVLSTGQTDEYCLSYESTGSTWEWADCSGSLFTNSGNLSYLTEQTDNLAIGSTTNPTSARLLVRGTSTNDILNLFSSGGSELLTVLSTGYVGIGDSSPAHLFTVGANDAFGIDVSASGLLFTNSLAATTTVVNNNPFAWTIATSTNGVPLFRVDTTQGAESIIIGGSNGSGDVVIGNVGLPTNLAFEESSIIHGQGENLLTFGQTGDRINFAVNVGIGSTSPSHALTVDGSIHLASTSIPTTTFALYNLGGSLYFNGSEVGNSPWSVAGSDIYYTGGSVGIGTSNPASNLEITTLSDSSIIRLHRDEGAVDVIGTGAFHELGRLNFVGTEESITTVGASIVASAYGVWNSGGDTTDAPTQLQFMTVPDGTDTLTARMTILPTGYIGIGTTTPTQLLSLSGSAPQAYFYDTNNNRGAYFGVGDGFNAVMDSHVGASIIKANGAAYLTVGGSKSYFENGDVGIGTTTPNRRLTVNETVAESQFRLSYDGPRHADFQIDSTGDLLMTATGDDVFFTDDNLWICESGSCPAITASSTAGYAIVENGIYFGNGFKIDQVTGTTTELGVYNGSGQLIIIFEEE